MTSTSAPDTDSFTTSASASTSVFAPAQDASRPTLAVASALVDASVRELEFLADMVDQQLKRRRAQAPTPVHKPTSKPAFKPASKPASKPVTVDALKTGAKPGRKPGVYGHYKPRRVLSQDELCHGRKKDGTQCSLSKRGKTDFCKHHQRHPLSSEDEEPRQKRRRLSFSIVIPGTPEEDVEKGDEIDDSESTQF